MSSLISKVGSYATVSAKVIRADGTIEDLGVIATTKKVSFLGRLKSWIMYRTQSR